jgi:hypothetical protein
MAGEGADDDGTAFVFWMFTLFAAGEERVQIHMGDPADVAVEGVPCAFRNEALGEKIHAHGEK